jgi:hypothetical protein
MESIVPKAKYRLGKITSKYHIFEIIFSSFYKQRGITYLLQASHTFRQLLIENLKAAYSTSVDALSHLADLPSTTSHLVLPVSLMIPVSFLALIGDRLYIAAE